MHSNSVLFRQRKFMTEHTNMHTYIDKRLWVADATVILFPFNSFFFPSDREEERVKFSLSK